MTRSYTLQTRRIMHEPEIGAEAAEVWTDAEIINLAETVLYETLRTFTVSFKRAERHDDALAWLLSDDTSTAFSFRNCCQILGLQAGELRELTLDQLEARGIIYA